MKKTVYLRLLVFSVIGALSLSLVSLFSLVRISDMVSSDFRYGYLLYLARSIEKTAETRPLSEVNVSKISPPVNTPKDDNFSLIEVTEFGPIIEEVVEVKPPRRSRRAKPQFELIQSRPSKPSLWLVNEQGKIISTNNLGELPVKWAKLPHPKKIHGITSSESSLLSPKTFIIKLDTTPVTYLVSYNEKSLWHGPFMWIQGVHTFTTAAIAVFLALSICFYYLRKKSSEARKVLAKLESGDLKARFEIKKVDQHGNLLLDFNRMADQIERLVKRLSATEASRSNLLQELGHDLRTPLTSLSTSFETLMAHYDEIDPEDRNELFSMIGADIRYFKDLLEKLTIVATIEGPHYKASTETIDLIELIDTEIRNRQTSSVAGKGLQWNLIRDEIQKKIILGDQHLITRLFKNAFDNASHYATSAINVKVKASTEKVEILVMDDGPGLTPEAIHSFGKRRERRHVKERDAHDFSLGLGSVIMKTIAEAHDGNIKMENLTVNNLIKGACLRITFKLA